MLMRRKHQLTHAAFNRPASSQMLRPRAARALFGALLVACWCLHEFAQGACTSAQGDPSQAKALLAVKAFLDDASALPTWGAGGGDPCPCHVQKVHLHQSSWAGVVCKGSQVVELRLANMNLTGGIHSSVGLLTSLQVLDLAGNAILVVPSALAKIPSLTTINLAGNDITCFLQPAWLASWAAEAGRSLLFDEAAEKCAVHYYY